MAASGRSEDLLAAIVPLMKLLKLTLIGLVLAHPRTGRIVPRATFRLLSKLVFALFLPCLIFVHLGQSITLRDALDWWFIPANVLVSTAVGCALGLAVAAVCRPPPRFFRFTVIMTGFGNTGNLPLAIIGSVCHSADNPFGPDCHTRGIAYVSFAQWVSVILVYTVVYHMMEPPVEISSAAAAAAADLIEEEDEEQEAPVVGGGSLSLPLFHEAEWPGMEEKETVHSKTPFIARVFNSISGSSSTAFPADLDLDLTAGEDDDEDEIDPGGGGSRRSPKSIRCLAEPKVVRRIRIVAEETPIRHVLQPPTIASLLAIVIGAVPAMKSFFHGGDAPLAFFTDSLDILAGAMVPSVMLILGGMIADGPSESALGLRTTVGIVVARLLVLPVLGMGVVAAADGAGVLSGDQNGAMYRFVLLLQYTTPSAILLGAIASLRGYAVKEASALLFWQHISAVFSLSLYLFVYFKLLL